MDEDILRSEISNFINNEFLAKELEAAKANNIIQGVDGGSINFVEKIITASIKKQDREAFYKQYLFYLLPELYCMEIDNIEILRLLMIMNSALRKTDLKALRFDCFPIY